MKFPLNVSKLSGNTYLKSNQSFPLNVMLGMRIFGIQIFSSEGFQIIQVVSLSRYIVYGICSGIWECAVEGNIYVLSLPVDILNEFSSLRIFITFVDFEISFQTTNYKFS